jgi:hypothetical protein
VGCRVVLTVDLIEELERAVLLLRERGARAGDGAEGGSQRSQQVVPEA